MAISSAFFGRKYRLTIQAPGDNGKLDVFEVEDGKPAMDIKFNVTYARGATARDGTISILGLGHRRIHDYVSLAAMCRGQAMSKLQRVRLEAGYFPQGNLIEILNGFAYYATVSSPPQMWLDIKVSEYNPLGDLPIEGIVGMTNMKPSVLLKTILAKVATREGVGFTHIDKTENSSFDSCDEPMKTSFTGKENLAGVIQKLNADFSDRWQFTLRTNRSTNGDRTVEVHSKKDFEVVPGAPALVDKDHGLLSVTGLDAVSGCVTTFLDTRYPDELTHLKLKSELNQQANGTYYILKKQYVGHYLGNEWYTRFFCSDRRKDN